MADSIWEKMQAIDRRIIFLFIAFAIAIPLIAPMGLPIRVTKEVESVYESINELKPGSVVLLSNDYDPASEPELYPMTLAIVRHCFEKNLRLVAMSLWPGAPGIITRALTVASKEYDKVEGEDYVNLGFKAGQVSVIVAMGQNLRDIFPDAQIKGKRVKTPEMPVLKGVENLRDIDYAVNIAAGVPGIDQWMTYGSDQYGFRLGAGCTAVMAADYYPFLASHQLDGLLGGLKGAAEYETLLDKPDQATAGMDAQTIAHLVIIAFVILGNIAYFATGRGKKEA